MIFFGNYLNFLPNMSKEIDYFKLAIKYIQDYRIEYLSQIEENNAIKGKCWEFFASIYMSKHLGTSFKTIENIEGVKKYQITDRDGNDIGIDLFDEKTTIVQCKNYQPNHSFKIEDLTNSISLRIANEKINYKLYFARPDDTKLGGKLMTHLNDKRFIDYPIPRKEYIDFLENCINESKKNNEIKENELKKEETKNEPDIRQYRQDQVFEKITSFLDSPKNILRAIDGNKIMSLS